MIAKYYEFHHRSEAQACRLRLQRLGWRPFTVFRTARRTWAFHLP